MVVLRIWHSHHPPLRDLLQTNSSLISGSRYPQCLCCVLQFFMHKEFSLQALRLHFNTNQIKVQWAEMIRRVALEALFWSEQKVSIGLPRGRLEKDRHTRNWAYCLILLHIFLLKNNKADLQTTPWLLNHYQCLRVFSLKQVETSSTSTNFEAHSN